MESYDAHWGFASFKNKTIIDFGADFGSTASYFLTKEAYKVIAVEGKPQLASQLSSKYFKHPHVVCIEQFINTPEHFFQIMFKYPADLVKVDIEGYEESLLHVPAHILLRVNEYLIETHSLVLLNNFLDLFKKFNYKTSLHYPHRVGSAVINVIWARKDKIS